MVNLSRLIWVESSDKQYFYGYTSQKKASLDADREPMFATEILTSTDYEDLLIKKNQEKFTNKKTAVEYFRRCEKKCYFEPTIKGNRCDYDIVIDGAVPTIDGSEYLFPEICLVREGRFYFVARLY
jgi:hypothetical protein